MAPNNATIEIAKTNCEFLCDVETLLGLLCVFPLLKLGQGLSKFAQGHGTIICDFVSTFKLVRTYLCAMYYESSMT
jgi:hypothetical protein